MQNDIWKHNPNFAYKSNDGPKLAITTREWYFKDIIGSYTKISTQTSNISWIISVE